MGFDPNFDRSSGIGASEVAAVCGLDPYRNALDIWLRKTGRTKQDEQSAAMRWGQIVESSLLAAYAEQHPDLVVTPTSEPIIFAPHCFASPDAVAYRAGHLSQNVERIVEAKNTGSATIAQQYGEAGTSEVPEHVYAQTQWQLAACGGVQRNDVIAGLLGQAPVTFTVFRDDNMIGGMRESVEKFWRDHVETDTPPEIDFESATREQIAALFPSPTKGMLELSADDHDARLLFAAYAEAYVAAKDADDVLDRRANEVRVALGEHEGILLPYGKIYYRKSKDGTSVDYKSIVEALRALIAGEALVETLDDLVKKHTSTREGVRSLRAYLAK